MEENKMQIKLISKGKSSTGVGQYGPWELLRFEIEAPNYKGITAGVFKNKENESWRAGDTVEVEAIEEKTNEKNGKTYKNYNIIMPKDSKKSGANNDEVMTALREVNKAIKRVEMKLDAKLTEQTIDEINSSTESVEGIPF
jgi:hypothetical protein